MERRSVIAHPAASGNLWGMFAAHVRGNGEGKSPGFNERLRAALLPESLSLRSAGFSMGEDLVGQVLLRPSHSVHPGNRPAPFDLRRILRVRQFATTAGLKRTSAGTASVSPRTYPILASSEDVEARRLMGVEKAM